MANEAIKLTTRESEILDALKSQHAREIATLEQKISGLENENATHKNNHRILNEKVLDLQTKLLAAQDRVMELQELKLTLRKLVNAP